MARLGVVLVAATASAALLTTSAVAAGNGVGAADLVEHAALSTALEPLGAPVDVTAVAGDTSATISWTDPSEVSLAPIDDHQIQVRVGGVLLRTLTGLGAQATNTAVTGLANGTTYTFRVVALSSEGASPPSADSNPVTPTSAPVVVSTTPANGATAARSTSNLTVVFDQAVQGISPTTVVLTDVGTNTPVPMTMSVGADGRTLSIDPVATLPAATRFRLLLRGTLPGDEQGIAAAGGRLPSASTLFATVTPAVAPVVTGVVPVAGVQPVERTANLRFDTSERVLGVTAATYRLQRVLTGGLGPALPAVVVGNGAGTRWTLDPRATLLPRARYQVTLVVGATSIRGAAGTPLAGSNGSTTSYSWRFTTRP